MADPIAVDKTVVRGDDYQAADGRALEWGSSGWPNLTGASVLFTAETYGHALSRAGSVVTPTGNAAVRAELSGADTGALPPGRPYDYDVKATLAGGSEVTLARGRLLVLEGLSALSADPLAPPPFADFLKLWVDDGSLWWQDAAGTVPATADAAPVLRADDRSGKGNHLSIAAAGPTCRNAVKNGRRVLRFDGVNQSLEKAFTLPQPWTLLLVSLSRSPADAQHKLSDGFAQVSGQLDFSAAGTFRVSAGVGLTVSPVDTAAWHALQGVFDGTNSKAKVDAGADAAGDTGPNTNPGGITLARRGGTSLLWCDCDIAAVLAWSRALTGQELSETAAWADARWGVY